MMAQRLSTMFQALTALETSLDTALSKDPAPLDGSAHEALEATGNLRQHIGQRRELAPEILVVALAGTTGAGKSSLFNLLTGSETATVGVRRPTTTKPTAALFANQHTSVDVQPLLDWLDIDQHVSVRTPPYDLGPVVLVDLPDVDSIMRNHRDIAQKFIDTVDVIVWVVDPEKYADGRVHEEYLRPLATHADVIEVVLNQTDRLTDREVDEVTADLQRVLSRDGFSSARVHTMSVRDGTGVESVTENLRQHALQRRAQSDRLIADARALGQRFMSELPPRKTDLTEALEEFTSQVLALSGSRGYADASAKRYRRSLLQKSGWPPLRPLYQLRSTPPLPELTTTHIARPVGDLSAQLAHQPGDYWSATLRREAIRAGTNLQTHLDGLAINEPVRNHPRWVRWLSLAQWFGLAVIFAGLVVGGVEIVIRYFQVTIPPALVGVPSEPGYPALPPLPWSALICAAGAVLAIFTAMVVGGVRSISTRRWRRHLDRHIGEQIRRIVTQQVLEPVSCLARVANDYHDAVMVLVGPREPETALE